MMKEQRIKYLNKNSNNNIEKKNESYRGKNL